VKEKNPCEPEFHQAVHEVFKSVSPVLERHPRYRKLKILERLTIPERPVMFRVPWIDDKGEVRYMFGQYKRLKNEFPGVLRARASNGEDLSSVPKPQAMAAYISPGRCLQQRVRAWRERPVSYPARET
jgi:hypothetical protein